MNELFYKVCLNTEKNHEMYHDEKEVTLAMDFDNRLSTSFFNKKMVRA